METKVMMSVALETSFHESAPQEGSSTRSFALGDLMGGVSAGLCAVHCLALGLSTSVFAMTGGWLADPRLRWALVCLAALFAAHSLRAGRRVRSRWPSSLVLGGLAALVFGRLLELPGATALFATLGEFVALVGGLALAAGHLGLFVGQQRASSAVVMAAMVPRWAAVAARGLVWSSLAVAVLYFVGGPRSLPASAMTSSAALGGIESDDGTIEVGWGLLAQLDPESGKRTPELSKVVGKRVRLPGYIVPIDEAGTEFLLAPWVGACFHAPTPPANQMVHVILGKGVTAIDPWGWDPLWVTGELEIVESESPYGAVSYFIRGESTSVYSWDG